MHCFFLAWPVYSHGFEINEYRSKQEPVWLHVQVRSLGETVRLDARTKLLNPKWYEGMLNIGYEGVREIQKRLTNTVGWSATSGQV